MRHVCCCGCWSSAGGVLKFPCRPTSSGCCVREAGGDFGYTEDNGNWPVCKPVPVVRYPRPAGYEPPKPYLTNQGEDGVCPD